MISNVDIMPFVPKFIRDDRNGFALAKAIESVLNDFLDIINEALKVTFDIEAMPEWRLERWRGN